MTKISEKELADRNILIPLFEDCKYDRVLINSVLEGNFGGAFADSVSQPVVARLDSGAFTMLGGNPLAVGAKDLLRIAPIQYVTPQDNEWRSLLQSEFGSRVSALPFTEFSSKTLRVNKLNKIILEIPPSYTLVQINKSLAERLTADIGNEYFFENFRSLDDFLGRGIGFCVIHQGRVVSAATSMAQSSKAIDIEIETLPEFRKQGLGTCVGARLVSHCLEHEIEPRWLAANADSERLALRLGYARGETYETYAI